MMLNILKSVLVFVVILFIIGLQLRKSKILRFLFRGTLRNIVADDKFFYDMENAMQSVRGKGRTNAEKMAIRQNIQLKQQESAIIREIGEIELRIRERNSRIIEIDLMDIPGLQKHQLAEPLEQANKLDEERMWQLRQLLS